MAEKTLTICDRCGKEIAYSIFPVFTARIYRTVKMGFGTYDYRRNYFDLCNECTKAFNHFMKDGTKMDLEDNA